MKVLRYERKYLTEQPHADVLVGMLRRHSGLFKEQYQPRRVCSLYFDTPDFYFFKQNIDGDHDRTKIRLRWYQELEQLPNLATATTDAQLEVKEKHGVLTSKLTQPLASPAKQLLLKIPDSNFGDYILNHLPPNKKMLKLLVPTLLNSYSRSYWFSSKLDIRITIDTDLLFYNPLAWMRGGLPQRLHATILEAKYSQASDNAMTEVSSKLPLRLTKSSKVCNGNSAAV